MVENLTKHIDSQTRKTGGNSTQIKGYQYDLIGNIEDSLTRYREITAKKESQIKEAPTPCLDDVQLKPEDFEEKGELKDDAAKLIMKVM